MSITNVDARRIGKHAAEYLPTKPRAGTVISTFRNGFSVLFDEDSDPGFVPFQTATVPLHPWAVEIPNLERTPSIGTHSTVEADRIRFDDELSICMGDAGICELLIRPWTQDEAGIAQLRVLRIEDSYGAKRIERFPGPLSQQSRQNLIRETATTLEVILRELVGSGIGSTPSGDDFIVGSLAVLWAARMFSSHAERQIKGFRTLLRWEKLVGRTPLPSAQMIIAASDGSFAEPIRAFLVAISHEQDWLIADAVHTLSAQGATSGLEVLSGILAAISNLEL